MREIKFRAWDTSRKKMWSAEEMGQDQEALLPDGRGFANISGDDFKLTQIHSHLIPLQYTGLKDKNDKEIYEGDVVLTKTKELKEIQWQEYRACFVCGELGFDEVWAFTFEVVGNIYEVCPLCGKPSPNGKEHKDCEDYEKMMADIGSKPPAEN